MVVESNSLSFLNKLRYLLPSKSKRYVMKYGKTHDNIIKLDIYDSGWNNVKCKVFFSYNYFGYFANPTIIQTTSVNDLWDFLIEMLVKIENMRNQEELFIWLDLLDVKPQIKCK